MGKPRLPEAPPEATQVVVQTSRGAAGLSLLLYGLSTYICLFGLWAGPGSGLDSQVFFGLYGFGLGVGLVLLAKAWRTLLNPEILLIADSEGITLPGQDRFLPWSEVESFADCKQGGSQLEIRLRCGEVARVQHNFLFRGFRPATKALLALQDQFQALGASPRPEELPEKTLEAGGAEAPTEVF